MDDQRYTDLEVRITHTDAAVEVLTHTLLQQEKMLTELTEEIRQIKRWLRQFSDTAASHEETPPPHY